MDTIFSPAYGVIPIANTIKALSSLHTECRNIYSAMRSLPYILQNVAMLYAETIWQAMEIQLTINPITDISVKEQTAGNTLLMI